MITTSELTCPQCGHVARETMPTDACIYFYDCAGCGVVLPAKGRGLLRVLLVRFCRLPPSAGRPIVLRHESSP